MILIAFLFGLILGIVFYLWQLAALRKKIEQILSLVSNDPAQLTSLPLTYIVRREIMNLHQQNQQLDKDLQTWQELMEDAPVGYLQVDEDNQLLWCNQQARQLLKIDRWQPKQLRLLLELVRSYELDRTIEQTRSSQKAQQQEWIFNFTNYSFAKNSSQLVNPAEQKVTDHREAIALTSYSFPLPKKQVAIFLLDRQPLVEIAQQSDRAFSDLAHELRTPLTSIALVAETLQKRLQDPERRWVEQMLKETDRLINLVADWLEISKLQENPTQSLRYETIELRELIDRVWATLEPFARQKSISLKYYGLECADIEADPQRLYQVFLNLLDNAIKHSLFKGTIEVKLSQIKLKKSNIKAIVIDAIDSGAGFQEADLPHIFERLYRGEKSRTRQFTSGGSGLGLAIVKQIIDAHGGQIKAQNHPQTGGAWLQIILPINRLAATAP